MNVAAALQALTAALELVEAGTAAAARINGILANANAAGRDVTDDELAEIRAQRHAIEQRLVAKLKVAAAG